MDSYLIEHLVPAYYTYDTYWDNYQTSFSACHAYNSTLQNWKKDNEEIKIYYDNLMGPDRDMMAGNPNMIFQQNIVFYYLN